MSRQREQKLGAIYDAFDARNYKGVIKLTNAAIQKYPDQWVFKSLKAVALDKTGKHDEAMQLVEEVLAAAPPDDHVLNMLLLVLKPANKVAALTPAYEAACSKAPGDEELMQGLFACQVRSFDFREQQQVAMRLNKQHPSEQYQWWVVCSLALQAHAAAAHAQLEAAAAATTGAAAQGGSAANETQKALATAAVAAAPSSSSSAGLGADKLLQLAEAMAARLLSKHGGGAAAAAGQHSWEAVMLYLGLLQAQGKYDAALAALRGPLADAFSLPAERREAEAALLLAKGDLAAAVQLYQQAVQEQPDDWALLLLYLDCLLPSTAETLPAISSAAVAQMLTGVEATTMADVQSGGLAALMAKLNVGDSTLPPVQDRTAQAEAFISSLPTTAAAAAAAGSANCVPANSDATNRPALLRGPALATVELAKRKLLLGVGEQQQLVDALLAYHDKLGHVVSCAMDLRRYLPLISGAAAASLSQQLQQRADQAAAELQQQQQQQGNTGGKQQLNLLRKQMSAMQIHADLGGPDFTTAAAAQQRAQQLMTWYATALPFYKELDERERGPADELLWLAAETLIKAAALEQQQQQLGADSASASGCSSSNGIGYMIQAVLVLEAAVNGRPYCAPARLGLTALYGLLGNTRAAGQHFAALDIKHIQHDTLSSQHLLPLLLGLGAGDAAHALLKSILALFEDHARDAGDTLMQAYKHGTHTKVLEFVCFKERLEHSHSYTLARAEQQLLAITKAATASGLEHTAAAATAAAAALPLQRLNSCDWQGMRFNDDLTTRLPWLPPVEGARHLMILLWWEQQQQQQQCSSSSSGEKQSCWWQRVAAAEADLPQAAQLRAAMRAAAQQRWLLPHLLAAILQTGSARSSISSSGGAAATPAQQQQQHGASLPELLALYAAALGCSSVAALELEISSCFGQQQADSSISSVAVSRQLQMLSAAIFMLAAPVQDALLHGHSEDADTASQTTAQDAIDRRASLLASGLQQLQQQLCAALDSSAADKDCLLTGHALSVGVLLTSECLAWLLVCLEAWSKTVKQTQSKKKPKKQPATAEPAATALATVQDASMAQLFEALGKVQAALSNSLEAVRGSAGKLLGVPVGDLEAKLLSEFDPSSNTDLRALVGWEQRASVQPVLVDLVKSQRQVLMQIDILSKVLLSRAAHVSW